MYFSGVEADSPPPKRSGSGGGMRPQSVPALPPPDLPEDTSVVEVSKISDSNKHHVLNTLRGLRGGAHLWVHHNLDFTPIQQWRY